jgi:hypothetical protein
MAEQLMYSNKDIELIKSAFAENDELLIMVRKLFFGVELTADEKKVVISNFSNPEVIEVLRRKVYGLNNLETPIGQLSDFWLGAESQIFGASRDTIYQAIMSKEIVLDMFTKAFDLLTNPDGEKVNVDVHILMEADPLGVKLIARNLYMKAIESALHAVKMIAGTKIETAEEAVKRLSKDSSK